MSERSWALLLVSAYGLLLLRHAVVGKRETRSLDDYYVGGRSMGGVAVGLSFFATYSSTNSYIGFAGQSYSYGLPWLLLVPCIVGFVTLAWLAVAPRLRVLTGALGSLTLPEFIGRRFASPAGRQAAALIVVLASVLYMTAVFKGIGTLLEAFLAVSYVNAILIVLVIVMGYTALGGFISVVKTDVVQGLLMLVAAALLFGGTAAAAGGIGAVARVRELPGGAQLFRWDAAMPLPVLLGILAAGTMKFIVEPRQLSRFFALRDERAVRQGLWVSLAAFTFAYTLLVPLGLYARLLLGEGLEDTDRVVPALLTGAVPFPAPVTAFLVVAMIAAAMSSLDSVLLVVASSFERDVVGAWRRRASDREALRATRIYVAVFALLTAAIALEPPGGIVALTAFSGSLYAACFFPAVVLGLHWLRGDGTAVLASFAAGIGVLMLWPYAPWGERVHAVFPALAASTAIYALLAATRPVALPPEVRRLFTPRDRGFVTSP